MKTIMLLAVVLLTGCAAATYNWQRCAFAKDAEGNILLDADGSPAKACSGASVKSNREIEGGVLAEYNFETNSFKIQTGNITTGTNPAADFGIKVADKLLDKFEDKL